MTSTHCGECGAPLTRAGRFLFCYAPACSMYGREVIDDNVARTETGAIHSALFPAPATASPETRESCVAPVPSSTPARRVAAHGADLSALVSSACTTTRTADQLLADMIRLTVLMQVYTALSGFRDARCIVAQMIEAES